MNKKDLEAFQALLNDAAKKRSINSDLRNQYRKSTDLQAHTRMRLIEDINRVFNCELNPYKGFAASRARYRQLGHYPEICVTDFFGNHQEFLRAAGLHDSREQTKVRNKAALLHTHQQIAAYAESHILPHVGLYDKTDALRGSTASTRVLVGSDFHSWFVDPFALEVFLDVARIAIAPLGSRGIIVLNGDVFDFPQISRHRQMPGHFHLNLHEERLYGQEKIIAPIREACPEATIFYVIGNHEYRLVTYIADKASALAGAPELEFESFLGIRQYNLSLVCRSSFLAPSAKARKKDIRENWHVLLDSWVVTHGTSIAKFAADVELNGAFRMSGSSGHTHRPQIVTSNSLATGAISWMSTPMMAGFAVGRDYVSTPSAWTMGFGLVTINPALRVCSQELILVHDQWAAYGGREWRPSKAVQARRAEQWKV